MPPPAFALRRSSLPTFVVALVAWGCGGRAGTVVDSGGTGGTTPAPAPYAGCHVAGDIDRLVLAKYDAQSERCVRLVLAADSGIPAFTGLTITAPWYAESASSWPSDTGDCARRDSPSGAWRATSGSGTITIAASSATVGVDATLIFRTGDAGAPQIAELKKQGVSISAGCP